MTAPVKCPHCRWWTLAPFRRVGDGWECYCWPCRAWVRWQAIAGR